jgi:hypothetical protein
MDVRLAEPQSGLGRMRISPTTWKLFAHACSDGVGALVFGLCLVLTIKHFDSLYITITVLFGVALIADLFWMRREVRRLAASVSEVKS